MWNYFLLEYIPFMLLQIKYLLSGANFQYPFGIDLFASVNLFFKVCGHTSTVSTIFAKGNNFCDCFLPLN